jgi:hypothetical protein
MQDLRAGPRRSGVVERRTMGAYHNGKRLIVSLEPGDTITMRVEGKQLRYTGSIGFVFIQLARLYGEEQAKKAKLERQAKREGLA